MDAPRATEAQPEWLLDLLTGTYFTPCPRHTASHKCERNFFCVDCRGASICAACVANEHSGSSNSSNIRSGNGDEAHVHPHRYPHRVLQIRRSSYHEAVRAADVAKLLDLSHVHTYVINSARIVFLNGRPQPRPIKGAPYYCETCHRTLVDNARFCSIACKLSALPLDPSLTLLPNRATAPGVVSARTQHGGARMPPPSPEWVQDEAAAPPGSPTSPTLSHERDTNARSPEDEHGDGGWPRFGGKRKGNGFRERRDERVGWERVATSSQLPPLLEEADDDVSIGDADQKEAGELCPSQWEKRKRRRRVVALPGGSLAKGDGNGGEDEGEAESRYDDETEHCLLPPPLVAAPSAAQCSGGHEPLTPLTPAASQHKWASTCGYTCATSTWRAHKRKGVPHRAPLF